MRHLTIGWLLILCLLPSAILAAPTAEPPDVALARAFVELMEEGFPGPDFDSLEPFALERPLALLFKRQTALSESDLLIRACLLSARRLHVAKLSGDVRGEDHRWQGVEANLIQCAQRLGELHAGHRAFCMVASFEGTGRQLSNARRKAALRRCSDETTTIIAMEEALTAAPGTPWPELAADSDLTPFDRRYVGALKGHWNARQSAAKGPEQTSGEAHLERQLYDRLQAVAAGDADSVEDLLAQEPAPFENHPDQRLMALVARALVKGTDVFSGRVESKPVADWLFAALLEPDLVASKGRTLAVGLAFLWALAPEAQVVEFMDQFLAATGPTPPPGVVLRVGLELLSAAARNQDVTSGQQALVLLSRSVLAPTLPPTRRFEAEVFLRFAQWLDSRLAGHGKEAMRDLQGHLKSLHARLPPESSPRIKGLVTLNLLAATACRKRGFLHDLELHLDSVTTRNTAYFVLWVNQYLEQRKSARAQAVLEWCQVDATRSAAKAACSLWEAYYRELIGETAAAQRARAEAESLMKETTSAIVSDGNVLLVEGERRVGFSPTPAGGIALRTAYSPAFFLVPLPRLATQQTPVEP